MATRRASLPEQPLLHYRLTPHVLHRYLRQGHTLGTRNRLEKQTRVNRQNAVSREKGFGNVLGIMKLEGKGIATGTPEALLISMAKIMTPISLNMIFDALK